MNSMNSSHEPGSPAHETSTPTSGIVVSELDSSIRPQDDLFRHVNATWATSHPIPPEKSRYGSFDELADRAEAAVREIVEKTQNTPDSAEARKIADLYYSFMDEERIQTLQLDPLQDVLEEIEGIDSVLGLVTAVGRAQRRGHGGLYALFIDSDPGDPTRYLAFLEQSGLSLPDESYYREPHFAHVREAHRQHVEQIFELAGYDRAGQRASSVVELETALAQHHWDNVASRDVEKTYNLSSWTGLVSALGSSLPADSSESAEALLLSWREGLGVGEEVFTEVVLRQPSFTESLAGLLYGLSLETWKSWLIFHVLHHNAPYLPEAFVEEHFNFYGKTLTGAQALRPRWKRGVGLVEAAMGEAVGRLYVEAHFDPQSKAHMDRLVRFLIQAYEKSITELDWMSDETKAQAAKKLAAFTPKVGYPSKWRDYSALEISRDDLIGNLASIGSFLFERELSKLGRPVDREEWFMTPQTVNAYYNPGFNEIVFPAAILQLPFFDAHRDDAENFGAIGAVIGHEIGHGFDDQGSKYDGDGRLRDWWTEDDRTAFEKLTKNLIDQYSELHPAEVPDGHVNGDLTIGENIGDVGGLGIAWKAYCLSLNGEEGPVIDGLSAAQRFFLSWAQAWRHQSRPEETARMLAIDPHSPPEFRCNQVVRNLDAFYEAFSLEESDELWLDPASRVVIW
jgi:putative endopeptidase